jgi:hypothetical protein
VVQTADLRNGDDPAALRPLDFPRNRRVVLQGLVTACPMIIIEEGRENSLEMAFVQNDDVIKAFAANGADQTLYERVLPGRARCDQHFLDPHVLHGAAEVVPVDAIPVAEQVTRRGVEREGLAD